MSQIKLCFLWAGVGSWKCSPQDMAHISENAIGRNFQPLRAQ
jgi:hypothetical protein